MSSKKIKDVAINNRKRQLAVTYSSGRTVTVHYASLGIHGNIQRAWVDKETRGLSVGIELSNGKIDYMPYDQPLALVKGPEFMLQTQIETLIAKVKQVLAAKKISKRYLAEQLHTSDNQIQRLLNPSILNKNLEQLYAITALVGLRLQLTATAA